MMLSLDSESANLSLLQQKVHRKRQRDTPIFFFFFLKIFSAGYVVLFIYLFFSTFSICVPETDAPSLPTRVCYEWPAVAALAQIHPGGLLQGRMLLRAAQ